MEVVLSFPSCPVPSNPTETYINYKLLGLFAHTIINPLFQLKLTHFYLCVYHHLTVAYR